MVNDVLQDLEGGLNKAIESLKRSPTRSDCLSESSKFLRMRVRARVTSSSVGGFAFKSSSTASIVAFASSRDFSWRTSALKSNKPASAKPEALPETLAAFFASTSAL